MLKGIIFDLDGTLADSLPVTFDAFNHGFVTYGAKVHSPTEIMDYFGPSEGEIFGRIVGETHVAPALSAFRDYLNQNLAQVPLFPGVAELLETVKSAGVPVSIVTGRSWDTTEIILNHHRVLDRFVTVICNGHVPSPKPSPLGIQLAQERMKLLPSETFYVGDHVMDIQAARAAGCQSVSALWDKMAKREHLAPHQPDYWAENPMQVWDLFRARKV